MNNKIILSILFASVSSFASDICQINSSELLNEILLSHPSIQASSEAIKGSDARIDSAKWGYYPTPSVEMSVKDKDRYTTVARLDQPLWTGGKLDSAYDIATSKKNETMYEFQETSYKLIENFLSILQNYTTSKANIVELEKGLKTLNEFGEMLDRRVDAGVSPYADKELINSRIKQINSDLIVAKNKYKVSLLQIEQLLSHTMKCGINVSSVNVLESNDIETLIKKMLDSHPSFKKIAHQIKTAQFELESTKASVMPDLKLRAEHQRGSLYDDNINLSQNLIYATFSVTTHAGLSAFSNVEAAKVKVHQIDFQKQTLEKELTDGVLTDYNNYLVATSKIDTLKSSIISSSNVLDSYSRLFVAGKKQWLDLVNASRELMQYSVDLSNQIALKQILEYKIALRTGRINLHNGKIDDI